MRRRRSRFDMQSVKFCKQTLTLNGDVATCDDPQDMTQFILVRPSEIGAIALANEVNELSTSKGIVFGGLTGDLIWSHNPIDDNVLNVNFDFISIWEAIHVQALDEFGFPTYLPRLSNPALGADRDVDLLWKRMTMMPVWGPGNDCGAGSCQLSLINGQNHDHIRIKSKRRITEKQALVYSVTFRVAHGSPVGGWNLELNGWLRLAVKTFS